MDYSWRNLNNIYQHVLKLGMLSPPEDVIASWLVFGSKRKIQNFLELGSYIGGGIAIFNEALYETGHANTAFVGVDHLDFIGARSQGLSGAWYSDHFQRCLTAEELDQLQHLNTANEAAVWISERGQRLTGQAIDLKCVMRESEIPRLQYDVIHHDYGDTVKENLATIEFCLELLDDHGVYVVDDWCTGAPLRTWSTVIAQQAGLIYPVLWGKNKVFFAKSKEAAQELVNDIQSNPECNTRLFKVMPGSEFFGSNYLPSNYKTIRMHWQAMQWS